MNRQLFAVRPVAVACLLLGLLLTACESEPQGGSNWSTTPSYGSGASVSGYSRYGSDPTSEPNPPREGNEDLEMTGQDEAEGKGANGPTNSPPPLE